MEGHCPVTKSTNSHISYLLLLHSATPHLSELVAALESPFTSIYAHVDAKAEDATRSAISRALPAGSIIRDSFIVNWGGIGMVDATLALMREALSRSGANSGHLVLLSGSDYPLASQEGIRRYLDMSRYDVHMNILPMPAPVADKPITRISRRYFEYDPHGGIARQLAPRALNLLRIPRLGYRRLLDGLQPFAGSQWWTMRTPVARSIVGESDKRPEILRLFRSARIPDEMFFQTLAGNTVPMSKIAPGLTFADFSSPTPPWPSTISDANLDRWERPGGLAIAGPYGQSRAIFARKFPSDSGELTSRVRREIWPLNHDYVAERGI